MNESQNTVKNHFNSLAKGYDEKAERRKSYLDAIDQLIIAYLKKNAHKEKAGKVILDIGCGTGTRAAKIAKDLNSPIIWGIDVAEQMIDHAQEKIDHAYVQNMSSLNLPVKFDAILCLFNAFGYLATYQERLQALRKIHAHLNEKGVLFIDVMNIRHKGEGRQFQRRNREVIKDVIYPLLKPGLGLGNKEFSIVVNNKEIPGFVHGFFDVEMKWLLQQAGFIIEQGYIVGYDSGEIKQKKSEGQLFYICRKG